MPGGNPGTVPVAARPAGRPHCWDPQSRPLERGCSSITSRPLGLAKPHFQILSPWAWVVSGWYWNQGLCCAWSSRPLTWRVSLWKSKEGSLEDRGRAVGSRRADCMSAKGQRRFPAAFSSWWNKCHKRAELRTQVVVVTGVQSAELGARPGRAWGPQAAGPGGLPPGSRCSWGDLSGSHGFSCSSCWELVSCQGTCVPVGATAR